MTDGIDKPTAAAGFTLLEVLVALAVLGFLIVGLTQGMRLMAQVYSRQQRMFDAVSGLDATDRTLRRLVEQMDPSADSAKLRLQGGAHAMRFVTALPLTARALQIRQAEVTVYVDGLHQLMLRWTPWRHGERVGPAPAPAETVLLQGVDRVDVFYLPRDFRASWRTTWSDPELPASVRIHIAFPVGDSRRWPDIVARPMRDRPS
jgi:general secretion pathway protein J